MPSYTVEELMSAMTKAMERFNAFAEASNKRHGEFQAELLDIQQRLARRGGSGGDPYLGGNRHALHALLENSAELKAVAERKFPRATIELPIGFFAPQAATLTSDGIAFPDQRPGIVRPAERRLRVRSLIPTVPTDGGSISYLSESGYTNQVAPQSEGDQKAESSLQFELASASVITLAHWCRVTLQALADVPTMQNYLEGRLKFGLADVEDQQLLLGSGTGNNLSGLYTQAQVFAGAAGTPIDRLRAAIDALELADFMATGIVMHSSDWAAIQTLKDSQSRYILGEPGGANPPTLWNLPVITTRVMTQGKFLVGAFSDAAILYDRQTPRLDVSFEDGDNFTRNLATLRVEERLALAIVRPEALLRGDVEGS